MAVELRVAEDDDRSAILELLQASLGWVPDDVYESFFVWKHHENPFGRSPAWVAVEDGRVLAFRTFLRWEWERNGGVERAVRAVDTATHPDAQGRGLFRQLTLHAVDAMCDEGVGFVFNTPNDQSRPGYLKMGWVDVGRPATRVRPRSIAALVRMASARVPAAKWSTPTTAGEAALDVLHDDRAIAALLTAAGPVLAGGMRTNRSPELLRWRYGFEPLSYRAVLLGDTVEDGLVVFRLRRRGGALEAAVVEVLAEPGAERRVRQGVRRVVRDTGADYAVALGPARRAAEGFLPLPGQGPRLTWRALRHDTCPPLEAWTVGLGDIELF